MRAIGTSNFLPAHLQRLIDATGVAPEVNQVQLSPVWTQAEARRFHAAHGIVTESWSPVGRGTALLQHPAVLAVARARGRTPGQVVLRWHLQCGLLPIPKTSNPQRLRENLALFDFQLDDTEMAALSALDGQGGPLLSPLDFGH